MNSGHCKKVIEELEPKAYQQVMDREVDDRPQDENNSSTSSLVFSFKYFREVDKLKSLVRDIESDIKSLCGDIRVIFAMKKHQSIGNLVVRNRKLSSGSEEGEDTSTQKCGSKRCKLCPLLFDVKEVMVNGQICKFDMKLNCKSDNVLYLNQCQVCPEYEDSYFGQTVTEAHIRMNGHRNKFDRNDNNYEKSALAFHCHDIHPDIFCLDNFRIGLVRQMPPQNLDREEDILIHKYKTHIWGLNRIKVRR